MSIHNYFVTIDYHVRGIFEGENAKEALDVYARSQLYRSWEARELATERKDDFGVWRIKDSIEVAGRDKEAARDLWIHLYRQEKKSPIRSCFISSTSAI